MPAFTSRIRIGAWTPERRQRMHAHLERVVRLSPYVLILLLPGSILLLPLYAWWMQKRKRRRAAQNTDVAGS